MEEAIKTLFENMLDGGYAPPESCEKSFSDNFEGATNVEWEEYDDHLEAIFYKEGVEHIALFSKDGILQEYRKTLPEGYLPYNVRHQMDARGEIMNRVLINKGNQVMYEVIYRDKDLNRFLVLVTDLGKILSEREL